MTDDDVWFEPKRFGYGAGLPVAWQGWVLLVGFILLVVGLGWVVAARHPVLYAVVILFATAALVVLSAQHTRGGWRWRWGGE